MCILVCYFGKQCLTRSIVHGAVEHLISVGANVDVRWDCLKDRPDDMAAPPTRDMLWAQIMGKRGRRLFYKCYNLFRGQRAAETWTSARLSLLHLAASAVTLVP